MQDRQHGTVADGVYEFVAVPARCQRPGFGLAVAHHYKCNQVGMVVHCAIGMRDAVSELSSLVDASRRFGGCVAPDTSRKAELPEETLHTGAVFTLVRVDFGIRSFEVSVRQYGGRAMPGTRDENGV
jgi:hypothetical protein